jgi:UDP-N-acetyl-D-glucosamine dehydrogenase
MMPSVVSTLVADGLNRFSKSIRGSKIMVLGVAYKKDVSDCRESPALDVMRLLKEKGAILTYNDPFVTTLRLGPSILKSVDTSAAEIAKHDCVIILTDHSSYDFRKIVQAAKLVVDTRNSTKELHQFKDRIIKLGAGNSVRPEHTSDRHKVTHAQITH